jgi:hypothetical protein
VGWWGWISYAIDDCDAAEVMAGRLTLHRGQKSMIKDEKTVKGEKGFEEIIGPAGY